MQPEPEQIRELHRARLTHWLADDTDLQSRYLQLSMAEQYLPLDTQSIVQVAGNASIREVLEKLDHAFKDRLQQLVIEPNYDFEFVCAEEAQCAQNQSEWHYTANHIKTIRQLFQQIRNDLEKAYGLRLRELEEQSKETIRLTFETVHDTQNRWVRVFLMCLGRRYSEGLNTLDELLRGKHLDCNFAWILRPMEIEISRLPRPEQMFSRWLTSEMEIRLRAINHLQENRLHDLAQGHQTEAWRIIQQQIEGLYIGEILQHVASRIQGKSTDEKVLNNSLI